MHVLNWSDNDINIYFSSCVVPPRPQVAITVTGTSVAGSLLSLLCTATSLVPLVTPPIISWINVDESDDITITTDLTVSPSTATVVFGPLRTSHGRVYVCVADYNIPAANLPNLNTTESTTVTVQGESYIDTFPLSLYSFPFHSPQT